MTENEKHMFKWELWMYVGIPFEKDGLNRRWRITSKIKQEIQ